ncbi:MAG TPA: UDP-2,4-diacetamido-2,4,6-trideoxy-beta-L-altropyranose hydrolase [Verrucomicrobiae bacterium]|nr:UDP-2,4-diacetamido-2,4,6-trideoxy-beta-L-altropyranose hydrolase [Verrucomicrobiae bacterium]
MPDHLLIRADGGGALGSGHIMRMIALGQAVSDRGNRVTIASSSCPESLAARVRQEGLMFERLLLNTKGGSPEDLQQSRDLAHSLGAKWVVLDGYHFRRDFQSSLRSSGLSVLAVDDYGHCEVWAADAVLNQNIFAPERRYASERTECRFLLGTRFALLRREFRLAAERLSNARPASAQERGRRNHLLVTLGGVDIDNIAGRVVAGLELIPADRITVKLLAGTANPHIESLRAMAKVSRHHIDVLHDVLDMPAAYERSDCVISAGGSTCWEWLFYQLPAAVICLADNQRPVIAGLVKHRLAVDLGWHEDLKPESIAHILKDWLNNCGKRIDVPDEIAIDAYGAMRVAAVLDETNTWLRPARASDSELWFNWANDPLVRANGFHPNPISWEDHQLWFDRHRESPDSRLWIGSDIKDVPLGYIRFHRRSPDEWEIGVAVSPERRGQGVGKRLVSLAVNDFARSLTQALPGSGVRTGRIVARVRPSNEASLKLFQSVGFKAIAIRSTADCCVLSTT